MAVLLFAVLPLVFVLLERLLLEFFVFVSEILLMKLRDDSFCLCRLVVSSALSFDRRESVLADLKLSKLFPTPDFGVMGELEKLL